MTATDDPYFTTLKYRSHDGIDLELSVSRYPRRTVWHANLRSAARLGPFRTKLDAIIAASHLLGRSAHEMRWEPATTAEEARC